MTSCHVLRFCSIKTEDFLNDELGNRCGSKGGLTIVIERGSPKTHLRYKYTRERCIIKLYIYETGVCQTMMMMMMMMMALHENINRHLYTQIDPHMQNKYLYINLNENLTEDLFCMTETSPGPTCLDFFLHRPDQILCMTCRNTLISTKRLPPVNLCKVIIPPTELLQWVAIIYDRIVIVLHLQLKYQGRYTPGKYLQPPETSCPMTLGTCHVSFQAYQSAMVSRNHKLPSFCRRKIDVT